MKNIFLLSTLMLFSFTNIFAQDSTLVIKVEDVSRVISKGEVPGFMVFIPSSTKKSIENVWKKAVMANSNSTKTTVKPTFKRSNGEYHATNVIIDEIYFDPMNVYSLIAGVGDGARITAFFEKDSVFIGNQSMEETYLSAKNFMRNFAISQRKVLAMENISDEEKTLKNYQKNLSTLKKDRDKFEKQNSKSTINIDNYDTDLRTNETDLSIIETQIKDLKLSIASVEKGTEAATEFESRLKEKQKKMKKIVSKNKSIQNKIVKEQQRIRKNEEGISDNLKEQEILTKDIDNQLAKIKDLNKSYQKIK